MAGSGLTGKASSRRLATRIRHSPQRRDNDWSVLLSRPMLRSNVGSRSAVSGCQTTVVIFLLQPDSRHLPTAYDRQLLTICCSIFEWLTKPELIMAVKARVIYLSTNEGVQISANARLIVVGQ